MFDKTKRRKPEQELNETESARCLYLRALHKEMNHLPGVNKLHGVLEDDHYFAVLFVHLPNGTLRDLLKRRIKLTEVEVKCYGY